MRHLLLLACFTLLADPLYAQRATLLHNLEFGAAGVFPLSGSRTNGFTAGAGLRAGYELRLHRHIGAEVGFTESWPIAADTCIGRPTCITSRQFLKLVDYGLRGVAPFASGRVELSVGAGGAYVWNQWKVYNNGALIHYSGKASFARDRKARVRIDFTLRHWRDLGRPTQQWLSTTGGVTVRLGRLP